MRVFGACLALALMGAGASALADEDHVSGMREVAALEDPQNALVGAAIYSRTGQRLGDVAALARAEDGAVLGITIEPLAGDDAAPAADTPPSQPGELATDAAPAALAFTVFGLSADRVLYDPATGIVMARATQDELTKLDADTAVETLAARLLAAASDTTES